MMGGEIGVSSEQNVGSRFWIELPRATHPLPAALAGLHPVTAPQALPGLCQRVLCIDDNPVNLKLLEQVLRLRPHIRLDNAHDPELGIELALVHRPDLILLDINMPGMDGYQVLEHLRSQPRLRDTPVIAVTANAMPRDIARGKAAGFTDYLTKPLDVSHFLEVLDQALARRSG